jgi:hypothetical protein
VWHRDLNGNGTPNWAHGGVGQVIGRGWQQFTHVLAGDNGIVYGVQR